MNPWIPVLALVIACLAVMADAYTTRSCINLGKYEGADFRRALIRSLGLDAGTYGVSLAFCAVVMLVNVYALDSAWGLIVGNVIIAAFFGKAALHNMRILRGD